MHKLLPVVNSNLLFNNLFFSDLLITPILYFILSILTLLVHQALLASLLGIIDVYTNLIVQVSRV